MTAAEKNIIVEKGSDFVIKLSITDGIGMAKDISGFAVKMYIMLQGDDKTIQYLAPSGALVEPTAMQGFDGVVTEGSRGKCEVVIDKRFTKLFPTSLPADTKDIFATEYSYRYHIDLDGAGGSVTESDSVDNWRVLRGKCAIRL